MMRISLIRIAFAALLVSLAGCGGDALIKLAYDPPPKSASPLALVSSLRVNMDRFIDERPEKTSIGRRFAAFNMPLGEAFSERPVTQIVRDAIGLELMRSGHTIVTQGENVSVSGTIHTLWAGTDVTALYWDVYGEVKISVDFSSSGSGKPFISRPYEARKVERTYSFPGNEIMQRVLTAALRDVVQAIGADSVLADALKKQAPK